MSLGGYRQRLIGAFRLPEHGRQARGAAQLGAIILVVVILMPLLFCVLGALHAPKPSRPDSRWRHGRADNFALALELASRQLVLWDDVAAEGVLDRWDAGFAHAAALSENATLAFRFADTAGQGLSAPLLVFGTRGAVPGDVAALYFNRIGTTDLVAYGRGALMGGEPPPAKGPLPSPVTVDRAIKTALQVFHDEGLTLGSGFEIEVSQDREGTWVVAAPWSRAVPMRPFEARTLVMVTPTGGTVFAGCRDPATEARDRAYVGSLLQAEVPIDAAIRKVFDEAAGHLLEDHWPEEGCLRIAWRPDDRHWSLIAEGIFRPEVPWSTCNHYAVFMDGRVEAIQ